MEIRNIAIISHVDHGKTTLTDALMAETGMQAGGTSMDSNALEQERGITIYSKNTSVIYNDTKINIVDTPGHADFGSEVERVLRSIDAVVLLVDAQEGPMPQTRFVLKKSVELGHQPIVVINKIDKPAAEPGRVQDEVLELLMEFDATEEQMEFTTLYAIGKDGVAMYEPEGEQNDLTPLLDTIVSEVPAAGGDTDAACSAQVFNLGYDTYMGRLAVARVYDGTVSSGDSVYLKRGDDEARRGTVTRLFTYHGQDRTAADTAPAGEIVMIAGLPDVCIGDTITTDADREPMPAIEVEQPTISLEFIINDSPFAGTEGTYVTGRQIAERLSKELEVNVGLQVDFEGETMRVHGRGELHISILLETMRREGYEVQVSQPQVIEREIDGVRSEPFEEVTVDVPAGTEGPVIEKLSKRGVIMQNMASHGEMMRVVFEGPTRGLLGYRGQFVMDTRGEGIFSSRMVGYRPHAGDVTRRQVGSMISMTRGAVTTHALGGLQERGTLYVSPQTEVYEGMVIGNTAKGEDLTVNPTKGKELTNFRSAGSDEQVTLAPPLEITIERGLELMSDDEYLEITPAAIRLRKKRLTEQARKKNA